MKPLFLTLAALCITASAQDNPLNLHSVGLHTRSWHSAPGFNNDNAGLNLRFQGGWTAGFYENSESKPGDRRTSFYAGRPFSTDKVSALGLEWSAAVTAGAVTGYRLAKVLPMVLPSVSAHYGKSELALAFAHKTDKRGAHALHLMLRQEF
jgi:hypothetical protein